MDDHHHDDDRLDRGLAFDVGTLMARRRALVLFAGAGAGVALAACGGGREPEGTPSSSSTTASTTSTTSPADGPPEGAGGGPPGGGMGGAETASSDDPNAIPNETAGPYPADGSNGPDVLLESGIARSDITASFGSSTTVAEGVPLTIALTVTDSTTSDPLPGHAVYLWHCDREGRYSMYSEGVEGENYLRGVQEADADGVVTFTSVVPGCYAGRWPHVHFEVYESLAVATASGDIVATSQLALPQDVCETVYATEGYEQSVENLSQVSLESDGIFSDGSDTQMAATTGSVGPGYTATLTVPVTTP
ncbi:MAG TPA: intradiol ring-cleavage dioxygenase [Iamia sp.]|nr:intradiol ring-cleavage dioxygenase [Iamia sp.]